MLSMVGLSIVGGSLIIDEVLVEVLVEFMVEEEQIFKGVEFMYLDKLNEVEEFFEILRFGYV